MPDFVMQVLPEPTIIEIAEVGIPGPPGVGSTWGTIAGTLSSQTDLQTALDSKEAVGVASAAVAAHEATYPHTDFVTDAELNAAIANKVEDTDPRLTNSRTPTGSAGGVLAGTYPNPSFAVDMATQTELNAAIASRISSTEKGTVNGVATLDADGKVPTTQLPALGAVQSVFSRTGAVIAETGDYTSDQITEGIANLYFSEARSRNAISAQGPLSYDAATGILGANITATNITDSTTLGRSLVTAPDAAAGRSAIGAVAGPGASTTNAIARFADNAGNLANSTAIINSSGDLAIASATASTSPTNGALTVAGGVGVGGDLFAAGGYVSAIAALKRGVAGTEFTGLELKSAFGATYGLTANNSGQLAFYKDGNQLVDFVYSPDGSLIRIGRVLVGNGLSYAPAVGFLDDPSGEESGLYRPAVGAVGILASRVEAARFTANGVAIAGTLKVGNSGSPIARCLSAIATLDFPSIATGSSEDLTVTVTGATAGDTVILGLPASPTAGIVFNGFVSAANTVTVRATNITAGAIDPASDSYRVAVIGF